ncbi:Mdm33 family-domain-containing protein [Entophlyctis helioformis]|nr:Mdm33 family-domain-containing protein [Entophlyctis helioformis]
MRQSWNDQRQAVLKQLDPWIQNVRSRLSTSQDSLADHLKNASNILNQLTGYEVVERRKLRVMEHSDRLEKSKEEARRAKLFFEETIDERRKCQRELNSLLQRKDSWTDTDITRFTELYRRDLSLEQLETTAQASYKSATEIFEKNQVEFLSEIRERYVEEQMFSDKIRQASTWWTWGLISTHFVLFMVIQFYVEPRKKENLKREVAAIIMETSERDRAALGEQLQLILGGSLTPAALALEGSKEQHSPNDDHTRFSKATADGQQDASKLAPKAPAPSSMSSMAFWQGACVGAAVSFISFVSFFGR